MISDIFFNRNRQKSRRHYNHRSRCRLAKRDMHKSRDPTGGTIPFRFLWVTGTTLHEIKHNSLCLNIINNIIDIDRICRRYNQIKNRLYVERNRVNVDSRNLPARRLFLFRKAKATLIEKNTSHENFNKLYGGDNHFFIDVARFKFSAGFKRYECPPVEQRRRVCLYRQ